jgi:hypothetical protein
LGDGGGPRGPYGLGADEEGDDDSGFDDSPAARRARELLATITADRRVRNAALIASTFGLDPVAVMSERDPLKRYVRLAAHNYVHSVGKQ